MAIEDLIRVSISDDEYQATLTIAPAFTDSLNDTKLKYFLRGQGVVYGIKEDAVASVCEDFINGKAITNVLIAEGVRPQKGEIPKIELKFEMSTRPKEDAQGRINYRETHAVVNVVAGQTLAIKRRLKPAINGITIGGKPVAMPKVEDVPLLAGSNVVKEEDDSTMYFKAKVDGALDFKNNVLSVFPVLDIKDDVDFNIGNIHFDGDVKIGRDVLADFVIESTGNVQIWGSAICCKISAKGDIDIRGGVIGKNKAELKAGRCIYSNFVENAIMTAEEDISVRNGMMGSQVHCKGYFSLELKKSRVVESTVVAGRGITAFVVGSQYSSNTRLVTGIDSVKEAEYLKVKKDLDDKVAEVHDIERRYGKQMLESKIIPRAIYDRAVKDVERWELLKLEAREISAKLKALEEAMYDYKATIEIREYLHPKVALKIGKYEITTSREYFKTIIKYSEDENRLIFK